MIRRFPLLPALILAVLVAPAVAQKDRNRNYEAERRYLESLRREIRNIESNISKMESSIDDRKKQLADAPKTIDPAVKEMNENEKRHEKAKDALPDARFKLDDAQKKVSEVMKSLRNEYDGADELDAQEKKIEEARTKRDALREKAVANMKANPEHEVLTKLVNQARIRVKVIKEQVEDGKGLSSDLIDASTELLNYETQLDAIEEGVLSKNEAYKKAEKDLEEAENTLDYLRMRMSEKLRTNPEFKSAEDKLAAAKEAFILAQKEVQEAARARFDAVAKVNKLKSQVRSFEADTNRLIAQKASLENQLRVKEQRARDYERSIRR